jgi:hypothetical protein
MKTAILRNCPLESADVFPVLVNTSVEKVDLKTKDERKKKNTYTHTHTHTLRSVQEPVLFSLLSAHVRVQFNILTGVNHGVG